MLCFYPKKLFCTIVSGLFAMNASAESANRILRNLIIGNSYTYYNCVLFDYLRGFKDDQRVELYTAQATIVAANLN